MQRFLKNYAVAESDSLVSNDYNWNDLSIGNDTLGADKFFGFTHPEHEKKSENIAVVLDDTDVQEKKTKENKKDTDGIENRGNSIESESLSSSLDDVHINQIKSQQTITEKGTGTRPLAPHNSKDQHIPNVIKSIQLYEEKKKMRMQKIQTIEREQRKFHAKPAPNFGAIHEARAQKRSLEDMKYTVPVTPKVVHTHRKNMERLQAKQKEIDAANKPKPFVSKDAEVLSKPPFMPQHKKKTPIVSAPFNLHSDERLRERKQFDQHFKLESERKEREQEEQRKAEDERIRKEIRKATTFKAHPNPFHSNT